MLGIALDQIDEKYEWAIHVSCLRNVWRIPRISGINLGMMDLKNRLGLENHISIELSRSIACVFEWLNKKKESICDIPVSFAIIEETSATIQLILSLSVRFPFIV